MQDSTNGESQPKKKIPIEVLFSESTLFVKEELEKKGYLVDVIDNDFMSMPQLIAMKDEIKTLVFVSISPIEMTAKGMFDKAKISAFMAFSSEREADCMVAIVYIKGPNGNSINTDGELELYYGDPNLYSANYDLFPSLF